MSHGRPRASPHTLRSSVSAPSAVADGRALGRPSTRRLHFLARQRSELVIRAHSAGLPSERDDVGDAGKRLNGAVADNGAEASLREMLGSEATFGYQVLG